MSAALQIDGGETLTVRQKQVLDAALALMVEQGDQLTMTAVAGRASCSKETLYKWFGDRDGLLTATVQWQAAKVTVGAVDRAHLDLDVAGRAARGIRRQLAVGHLDQNLDRAQPDGGLAMPAPISATSARSCWKTAASPLRGG